MSWKQNQWDKQPTLSGKNNYTNTKASYEDINISKKIGSMDASMGVITGILPQKFVSSLDEGETSNESQLLQLQSHALSFVQKSGDETDSFDVEVGISGGRIRQFQNDDGIKNTAIIGSEYNNSRVILSTDLSSNGDIDFSNSLVLDICGNTVVGKEKGSTTNNPQKDVNEKFKFNVCGRTYLAKPDKWRDSVGSSNNPGFDDYPYTLYIDGNARIRGELDVDSLNYQVDTRIDKNLEVGGSIFIVGSTYDPSWDEQNDPYDPNTYTPNLATNDIGNQLDVNQWYYVDMSGTDAEEGQLWVFNDVHFMSDMDVCGNAIIGSDISSSSNNGFAEPRLTVYQQVNDSFDTSAALTISTAQETTAAFAITNSEDTSAWYMGGNTDFGWISADSSNVTFSGMNGAIFIAKDTNSDNLKNAVAIHPDGNWTAITRPLEVGHTDGHLSAYFSGEIETSRPSDIWYPDTFMDSSCGLMLHGGNSNESATNIISFTQNHHSATDFSCVGQFSHVRFDVSGERQGFVLSSSRGLDDGTGTNTYDFDFKDMAFFVRDGSDNTKFSTAGDPSLSQVDTWFPKHTVGIGDQPGGDFQNGYVNNVGLTIMNNSLQEQDPTYQDAVSGSTFIQLGTATSQGNCGEIWYTIREYASNYFNRVLRLNMYGNEQNISLFDNSCVGIGFGTDPSNNNTTDISGNEASLAVNAVSSNNERPVLRIIRDSSVGSRGINTYMEQVSTSSDGGTRQIGWDTETTVYTSTGDPYTGSITTDGTTNAYFDITTTDSSNIPCYQIFQNKSGGKEDKDETSGGGVGIIVQPVYGTGEQNIWFGKAGTLATGTDEDNQINTEPGGSYVDVPYNPLGIIVDVSGAIGVGMTSKTSSVSEAIAREINQPDTRVQSLYMAGNNNVGLTDYSDYRFVVSAQSYTSDSTESVTSSKPYDQSYPMMSVGGYHTGTYTKTSDPKYTLTDISYVQYYVEDYVDNQPSDSLWQDAGSNTLQPISTYQNTAITGTSTAGSVFTTSYTARDASDNHQLTDISYVQYYVEDYVDNHEGVNDSLWQEITKDAAGNKALIPLLDADGNPQYPDVEITGTSTAASFNATSDKSKKENIETIPDALETISKLRGVEFNFIDDNEKSLHRGVIAQELEEIYPEMVKGEEGNKSVAYMEIIGVLIESVKELKARVEELEKER